MHGCDCERKHIRPALCYSSGSEFQLSIPRPLENLGTRKNIRVSAMRYLAITALPIVILALCELVTDCNGSYGFNHLDESDLSGPPRSSHDLKDLKWWKDVKPSRLKSRYDGRLENVLELTCCNSSCSYKTCYACIAVRLIESFPTELKNE